LKAEGKETFVVEWRPNNVKYFSFHGTGFEKSNSPPSCKNEEIKGISPIKKRESNINLRSSSRKR